MPAKKALAPKAPPKKSIAEKKKSTTEARIAKLRQTAIAAHSPSMAVANKADRHLTEMQLMFVRHWAAGESVLSASSRAGYKDGGTYGYRMAKDPAILKIYEREKKLYEASVQMTRKKVMDGLVRAAEIAEIQADATGMVAAWREVGKLCGYYEPVKKTLDININGQITQKVERLSDADLLSIIKGDTANAAQLLGDVIEGQFTEIIEEEANAEED